MSSNGSKEYSDVTNEELARIRRRAFGSDEKDDKHRLIPPHMGEEHSST